MDAIQAILQASQGQDANLSAGSAKLKDMSATMQALFDNSTRTSTAAINQATEANNAGVAIDYQKNKQREDIQSLHGLNISDPNNVLATNLGVIKQAQDQQAQARAEYVPARAEYDAAASVGLLDNPLQYIVNQFKLPQLAAKVNAIDSARERASEQEQQAVLRNTQALQGEAMANSTLVAQTADAEREVALKQVQSKAMLAQAELQRHQADDMSRVASVQMQALTLDDKRNDNLRQAAVTVAHIQQARDNHALHVESMKNAAIERQLKLGMLQDRADQLKEKQAAEDAANAQLSVAAASLGWTNAPTIKTLKLLPAAQGKAFAEYAQTGQLGGDLQSSLQFYLSGGGANKQGLGAGSQPQYLSARKMMESGKTAEFEAQASKEFTTMLAANPGMPKPKQTDIDRRAFELYQSSIASTVLSKDAAAPSMTDSIWDNKVYNPNKLPFVTAVGLIDSGKVPQLAGLQDNIMQKYMKARLAAGPLTAERGENISGQDFKVIMKNIGNEIGARKITPQAAAQQVSQYIQKLAQYQYESVKPDLFGLPRPEGYYVSMPIDTKIFGQAEPTRFNAADQRMLENVFTKLGRGAAISGVYGANPFAGGLLNSQADIDANAARAQKNKSADPNRPF